MLSLRMTEMDCKALWLFDVFFDTWSSAFDWMRNTVPWFPLSVIQPVHAATRDEAVLVMESKYTTLGTKPCPMKKLAYQQSWPTAWSFRAFAFILRIPASLSCATIDTCQPSEILDIPDFAKNSKTICLRSAPPLDHPRPLEAHLPPLDAQGWDWALWQVCFEAPQRNG